MPEWMWNTLGIVLFAFGILMSIALHELGHMIPAKRGGVKVTDYMIGFGPTLWSRKRGETEYGIKAIPLGGFVKMIGMYPPANPNRKQKTGNTGKRRFFGSLIDEARQVSLDQVGPGEEPRAFYSKSMRRKLLVMFSGPAVNLVLALIFFTFGLAVVGVEDFTSTTIGSVKTCVIPAGQQEDTCPVGAESAPAVKAGLHRDDTIVALDGQPVSDWGQIVDGIQSKGGSPVQVQVKNAEGVERSVVLTPVMTQVRKADGSIGEGGLIGITSKKVLRQIPLTEVPQLIGSMTKATVMGVVNLPKKMVGVWQAAFGDTERDRMGPVGMVGAARLGGEALVEEDLGAPGKISRFILLFAALNLGLFVFNMVPLPPLDGGHMVGAVWEGARRKIAQLLHRPDPGFVDVARLLPVAYGVAILFIGMSILLVYADIVNPIRLNG